MKPLLTRVLFCVVATTVLVFANLRAVVGQNITTTIGSYNPASCAVGDTIVLPVTVNMATGISTAAISMAVDFDTTKLRAICTGSGASISCVTNLNPAIASGFLSNVTNFSNQSPNPPFNSSTRKQFRAAWFNLVPVAFNGLMFNLRFVVVGTGNSVVKWDLATPGNCEFADEWAEVIPNCDFVNGNITCSSGTTPCVPPSAAITPAGPTTFCQGGSVVLNANTGTGLTYQWNNNGTAISGATNASYTANAAGSYTVIVYNAPTCSAVSAATQVSASSNNTIALTSAAGTNAQTRCVTTAITNIAYTTTGATGATVTGLPAGVSGTWANNTFTISGTPTATGTFNYTVTMTGGCTGGTNTATGSIVVNGNNTIALSSAAGTNNQSITVNTAIANITYTTTGATEATFSGLPTGVTGTWTNNTVTLSGTPTATGTFNYTVTMTGGCTAGTNTATGSITVNAGGGGNFNIQTTIGSFNSSTCAVGDTITLPVNVSMASGISTAAISFALDFDTTKLRAVCTGSGSSISCVSNLNANIASGFLSNVTNFSNQSPNPPYTSTTRKQFRAAWFNLVPVSFNGLMFNLRFVVVGTGNSVVKWDLATPGNCEYADELADVIPNCDFVDGTITCGTAGPPPCVPPSAAITAAGPTTFCQGGSVVLNANTGTGLTYQWNNNGAAIAGATNASYTANAAGSYTVIVYNTPTCSAVSAATQVSASSNNTIALTSAAGTNAQTRCVTTAITNITYATTGATGATVTGLPTGVSGTWANNAVTISGTPTAAGTFNYTVTMTGGCTGGTNTATGSIVVNGNNSIALSSAAGTNAQTRCVNTAITAITYSTTGATGATFAGLPAGVTGTWANNTVTVSGTPTATGTFNYTVTMTGGCSGGTNTATGSIVVNGNNTIALTSAVGTNAQTRCVNTAITAITYSTTGATGATVSGLPAGVSGTWANNTVSISGTPTATGTFTYTVTMTGGCTGGTNTATGSIVVNGNNTIALSSAAGSDNQSVTVNTAIANITYSTTGATGAAFSGLPAGVTGTWANNTVTLSGTPTATGTFNYTVTMTGGCTAGTNTATGTVTVNPAGPNISTSIASVSGCIGDTVTVPVTINMASGISVAAISMAIDFDTTKLRALCTGSGASISCVTNLNPVIASGFLSNVTNFSNQVPNPPYTATTRKQFRAAWFNLVPVAFSGTMFELRFVVLAGGSADIKWDLATPGNCEYADELADVVPNTQWNDGTYSLASACCTPPAASITPAGSTTFCQGGSVVLNANTGSGLTYQWNNNGTPIAGATNASYTATTEGSYTVVVANTPTCFNVSGPVQVVVNGNNTIALTSAAGTNAQTRCVNNAITAITYSTTRATGATVTGLPAGVTGTWANNTVTISGTPTATGTFTYTVTMTGGCTGGTNTATGSITVNGNNTIALSSAAGSDNQSVTVNTAIANITYSTTGATGAAFSGLPAGVTGTWANNTVTLSGTPTATGTFNYTVTMTGGCTAGTNTATGTVTVNPAGPNISTSIASVSGCIGDTVTVPVTINMASGISVAAISMAIDFDTTKLRALCTGSGASISCVTNLNPVIASGFLSNVTNFSNQVPNPPYTATTRKQFRAAWFNLVPVAFSGTMFELRFVVLAGGSADIKWDLATPGNCEYADELADVVPNTQWNDGTYSLASACCTPPAASITPAGSTTFCQGGSVVLNANTGSGLTYQWNNNGTPIAGATNASYTATTEGSYTVVVANTPTCFNVSGPVQVVVNGNNTIALTSAAGTNAQTRCVNNAITAITYSTTRATGATVTGLPAGVTGTWANNTVTISGTPTATGTFTYTVTMTGGCTGGTNTATGSITVNGNNTIALSSAAGSDNQSVTVNTAIANITYSTTGATGAAFSGLPAGVTGTWANNTVTLSGTPTATGTFNYTVTMTGGCTAGTNTATGTVTVNPAGPNISTSIASVSGCIGDTVTVPVTINMASGISVAAISMAIDFDTTKLRALCTGSGASISCVTNLNPFIASGFLSNVTNFSNQVPNPPYTATTRKQFRAAWFNLVPVAFSGTMFELRFVVLAGGSADIKWDLATPGNCEYADELADVVPNTQWNDGTYSLASACCTPPAASITPAGSTTFCQGGSVVLNANTGSGLTYQWNNNGTPIAGATNASYTATTEGSYTVVVANTPTCFNVSGPVQVVVNGNNTIALTSAAGTNAQTRCVNNAITAITYSTTRATGATVTGLPAGVTGTWANNTVSISGTPTATGTFTYTVTMTGGCTGGTNTATGSIVVNGNNTIALSSAAGSDNQSVTVNTAIANITYSTTGATGAAFSGLPAGVTGTWANNTVTLSGTPTATGTFNYTVTMTGGCTAGTNTATGTVTVNPAGPNISTSIASVSGCIGDTVTVPVTINMASGISVAAISMAIDFDTTKLRALCTGSGASISCVTNLNPVIASGFLSNVTNFSNQVPNPPYTATTRKQFRAAWFNLVPVAFSGTMFELRFVVLAGGSADIKWDLATPGNCEYADELADVVPNTQWNDGTYSLASACCTPPAASITPAGSTTFCQGGSVVLNANTGSGLTYQWNNNGTPIAGATNASYTATTEGSYTVVVANTPTCFNVSGPVQVVVNGNNTIALTSAAGTNAQTRCVNNAITAITYSTTRATGATVTGLPAGVTGTWANNTVSISGTPTATGTFTYTVTMTGGCTGGTNTATGSITVNGNNTIALSSAAGSDNQSVTVNTAIANITYSTTGATGAAFSGLPAGVTGTWANNTVTLSGTPTATGTFNYTVTMTGGCTAGTNTATGTVTVNPAGPNISTSIASVSGCIGDTVTVPVTINMASGISVAAISMAIDFDTTKLRALCTGSGASISCVTNLNPFIASGFLSNVTNFSNQVPNPPYTATTRKQFRAAWFNLVPVAFSGTMFELRFVVLAGGSADIKWDLATPGNCEYADELADVVPNTQWNDGTYSLASACCTPPAASITPAGSTTFCQGGSVVLNANTGSGLTYQWNNNGTPIAGATNASYTATTEGSYTVVVANTPTCFNVSGPVQVVVNGNNTIALTSAAGTNAQTRCVNNAITAITYSTTRATGATVTGLPAGVTGTWANNTVSISGTPTATGTFTYTVTMTGGCTGGTNTATGSIVVNGNNTIALSSAAGSDNQSVTVNTAIANITYSTTGATGAAFSGLPAGVTGTWANNTVTLSGTPTATGTFNYTVTMTGGCTAGTNTATGTVTVNPAGPNISTSIASVSGCIGDTVTVPVTINMASGISVAAISMAIDFDTTKLRALCTGSGASISCVTNLNPVIASGFLSNVTNFSNQVPNPPYTATTRKQFRAAWFNLVPVAFSGTMFELRFVVLAGGSADIKWDLATPGNCEYADELADVVPNTQWNDGTYSLASACCTPPAASITPAGSTTFCQGGSVVLNANTGSGLTYQWNNNGTPIAGATNASYTATTEGSYTVVVANTPTCFNVSGPVQVVVNGNNTIALTSAAGTNAQTRCVNNAITAITYSTTRATGATVTGLPAGVTGTWANNTVSISGTPTATGTFTYTVTMTGGCTGGTNTATGSIVVNGNNTIALSSAAGSDNQSVTVNTAIANITYSTTGATGAAFSGLPAGVTGTWANNTVTLSGTPTATGTFNYTVTMTGGCTAGTNTATGTVTVNPAGPNISTSIASVSGCIGDTVTVPVTINMASGISVAAISMAIDFDTTKLRALCTGSGASISCVTNLNPVIASGFLSNVTNFSNQVPNPPYTATTRKQFRAAWFNLVPVAFSGTMFELRFVVLAGGSADIKWDLATPGNCEYADELADVVPNTQWNDGTYSLASACCTPPAASITPAGSTTFCQGGSVVLNANTGSGLTYQWNNNGTPIAGATNASYTATTEGSYTVVVANTPTCFNVSGPVQVVVNGNNTIALTSAAGTNAQTRCVNNAITAITYSTTRATGATVAGLPAGVTGTWANNTVTISGTPTATGTFTYTVTMTGGCTGGTNTATGSIVVNGNNTIALSSAAGSDNQSVTVNTAIANITYSTTGATGAAFSGLPAGVTGTWANNTVTLSGTPTATGTFNYTVTMTGGCTAGTNTATGTVTVNPAGPNISTSIASVSGCIGDTVTVPVTINMASGISVAAISMAIDFDTTKLRALCTGSGASISCVTNLNPVIASGFLSNVTNFSNQVPNPPYTATTRKQFRAAWFNLVPVAFSGTMFELRFVVLAGGSADIKWDLATPGNCEYADELADVVPNTQWNDGTYSLASACCTPPAASITPAGSTTFCQGGSVVLNANTGSGLTYQWNNNGTPIAGATNASYTATTEGSYTVVVANTPTCFNVSGPVQVVVNGNNTIALTSAAGTNAQTRCVNNAITAITYSTTRATGATVTGLPAGVTGTWANNTVTISGTPTATGTFTYTVTMTGGCTGGTNTATGSITVNGNNTIALSSAAGSDNQSVTVNTAIANITYSTTGATGAAFSGLPAGVTGTWANNTVTLSGTPTATGTFNYTVTMTGGCTAGTNTATGTVTVNPAGPNISTSIASVSGCIGDTVTVPVTINMASGISVAAISMAIDFDTTKLRALCTGSGASISCVTNLNPVIASGFLSNVTNFSNQVPNPPYTATTRKQFRAAWFNLVPVAFSGTMFELRFVVLAGGSADIKWDLATPGNCEYADELADVVPNTQWNDGNIGVGGCTVCPAPNAVITPVGPLTICQGSSVVLNANTGFGLSYQWNLNGTPITGATNQTFTANTLGSYSVTIINPSNCSSTSGQVSINVTNSPATPVLSANKNQICSGDSATLTATPVSQFLTYQWYLDGILIQGVNSYSYKTMMPGSYTVRTLNTGGCLSAFSNSINIQLLVSTPPQVSQQPSNQTVSIGDTAFFEIQATNYDSIQWQVSPNNNVWLNLSQGQSGLYFDVTTNRLKIAANSPSLNGNFYRAVLSGVSYCAPNTVSSSVNLFVNQNTTTILSIDSISSCESSTNDTLTLDVFANRFINVGIASFDFEISPALTFLGISNRNPLLFSLNSQVSGNNVSVNGFGTTNVTLPNNSRLFSLRILLPANTSGTQLVNWLSSTYIADVLQGSWSTNLINGKVDVKPTPTSSINISICSGDSFQCGNQTFDSTGNYIINLTSTNGCDSVVSLNLVVLPNASSLLNVSICEGQQYVFGSQTLTSTGNYTRTITAANGCDSTISLSLAVNANSNSNISVTICQGQAYLFGTQSLTSAGTYSLTIPSANGCDSTITLVLNVSQPQVTIATTGNLTICQGDSTQIVASPSIIGATYQWKRNGVDIPGANDTLLVAKQTGIYSVFISVNGCTNSSNTVQVIVNSRPAKPILTANILNACDGGTIILSATPSSSFLTYFWYRDGILVTPNGLNGSSGGATLQVTTSGLYQVESQNNLGCRSERSEGQTLSFTQPATIAQHPAAQSVAYNGNASFSVAMSGGSGYQYQWQIRMPGGVSWINMTSPIGSSSASGFTSPTLNLTGISSGINGADFRVRVTKNSGCFENLLSDPARLNVGNSDPVSVQIGSSSFCSGTNTLVSVPMVVNNFSNIALIDMRVSLGSSLTFNGLSSVNPALSSVSAIVLPSGILSLSWYSSGSLSLPNGTSLFNLDLLATSTDTARIASGTTFSDRFGGNIPYLGGSDGIITENAPTVPTVNATSNFVCAGSGQSVTLSGTPTGGIFSGTGISGNTFVTTGLPEGTYVITYTYVNPLGCSATTQIGLEIRPNPTATVSPATATLCSGQSVTLSANTGTGLSYQWRLNGNPISGATQSNFNASSNGSYSVAVTSGGCTTVSSNSTVIVNSPSPLSISNGDTIRLCIGDSRTLIASSGFTSYQWYPIYAISNNSVFNPIITPRRNETYTVFATSANGCIASKQIVVLVDSLPAVDAGNDQYVVTGGNVNLIATGAGVNGTYQWSHGINGAVSNVNPTTTTTYYVTGTNSTGCSKIDSVRVFVPQILAGPNQIACQGQNLTLQGFLIDYPTSAQSPIFKWSRLLNGNQILLGSNLLVTIQITSTNTDSLIFSADLPDGSTLSDTVLVNTLSTPLVSISNTAISVAPSGSIPIGASITGASGNRTLAWTILGTTVGGSGTLSSTTVPNPTYTAPPIATIDSVKLVIQVTNPNGCGSRDTLTVVIDPALQGKTIRGVLRYDNATGSPVNNAVIRLTNSQNQETTTEVNSQGGFFFANLPDGNYSVSVVVDSLNSRKTNAGITSADVQLINGYRLNRATSPLNGNTPSAKLRLRAADVSTVLGASNTAGADTISIADAQAASQKAANGNPLNAFNLATPPRIWALPASATTVTLAGQDANVDLYTVSYGDVNGSFSPLLRQNNRLATESFGWLNSSSGSRLTYPIRSGQDLEISSMQMSLRLNDGYKVISANVPGDETPVVINQIGNDVTLVWFSENGNALLKRNNDDLILLELSKKGNETWQQPVVNQELINVEFNDVWAQNASNPLIKIPQVGTDSDFIVTLYPNPIYSGQQMSIHVFSPIRGDLSLRIFDMTGRLVHSEFVSGLVKGSSITTLSKALPAGAYHLDWNIYADSITKAGNVKFNVFK